MHMMTKASYMLPPKKKMKGKMVMEMPPMDHYRRVTIPVNKDIVDALMVGKPASITLMGEVCELSSKDYEGNPMHMMKMELKEVVASEDYEMDMGKMTPSEYRQYRMKGKSKKMDYTT